MWIMYEESNLTRDFSKFPFNLFNPENPGSLKSWFFNTFYRIIQEIRKRISGKPVKFAAA